MNKYYNKFVDFFERHNLYDKEVFDFLRNNSIMFDYRDEDARLLIGNSYSLKDGRIDKITLFVPFIDDDITAFININEYVHGLIFYKNIGKRPINEEYIEILPMFYERLFVEENSDNERLINYYKRLNDCITDEYPKYKLGQEISEELYKDYLNSDDLNSINRKANKLIVKKRIRKLFNK